MTPEAKIKAEISAYLKKIGAYEFRPVQRGLGKTTVDHLACYKGRFVGIEAKVWPKMPTPRQARVLANIRDAGGWAIVAHSVLDVKMCLYNG